MIYHPSKCHDLPVKQAQIELKKAKEESRPFKTNFGTRQRALTFHFNLPLCTVPQCRLNISLLGVSGPVYCMGLTYRAVQRADSGVLSDLPFKTSRPLDSGQKTPSNHA